MYFLNGLFYAFLAIHLFAAALIFHPLVKPRGIVIYGPWLYVILALPLRAQGFRFDTSDATSARDAREKLRADMLPFVECH